MRAAVFVVCAVCASLVGIEDDRPLRCDALAVIDNTGGAVDVVPAFASDHPDYDATAPAGVTSVQVEIACDDPDATIDINGTQVGADGRGEPLPVPAMFQIAVRAGTVDPPPELDYHVAVGVAP